MIAFRIYLTDKDLQEWTVEVDEEFLEMFLDSLFSWARRGAKPTTPHAPQDSGEEYKDLDSFITFGKYKGKKWRDIMATDPEYVQWAATNVDRIPENFKLELKLGLGANTPAPPGQKDIPF